MAVLPHSVAKLMAHITAPVHTERQCTKQWSLCSAAPAATTGQTNTGYSAGKRRNKVEGVAEKVNLGKQKHQHTTHTQQAEYQE